MRCGSDMPCGGGAVTHITDTCAHQRQVGGSLAPEPQMMQELEGSPYYFPPPSAEGLAPPSLGPPPPTLATPKTAESTRNGSSNSD